MYHQSEYQFETLDRARDIEAAYEREQEAEEARAREIEEELNYREPDEDPDDSDNPVLNAANAWARRQARRFERSDFDTREERAEAFGLDEEAA
jgi:hypothetical protein